MKIEVWTDIMCPYCYIGKIRYEKALSRFAHADEVELQIKAFQLNPNLPDKGKGYPVVDYLTQTAGYPEAAVKQMFAQLQKLADDEGVKFNLPNAFAANTMDAHRLIKFAAKQNLDSTVLSKISKAYFEDAIDYSDIDFLVETGASVGLDEKQVREMLLGNDFRAEVLDDIAEANQLGIHTVPTFLFDRKSAIIGSESVDVFLETLNKSYSNSNNSNIRKGKSCNADGVCEI